MTGLMLMSCFLFLTTKWNPSARPRNNCPVSLECAANKHPSWTRDRPTKRLGAWPCTARVAPGHTPGQPSIKAQASPKENTLPALWSFDPRGLENDGFPASRGYVFDEFFTDRACVIGISGDPVISSPFASALDWKRASLP